MNRKGEGGADSAHRTAILPANGEIADLLERIADPEIKQKLRDNTDELIARGGFGSPTIFIDGDDMYFGNDRLQLVRAALAETR